MGGGEGQGRGLRVEAGDGGRERGQGAGQGQGQGQGQGRGRNRDRGQGQGDDLCLAQFGAKRRSKGTCNMVRGQSWRALSGVAAVGGGYGRFWVRKDAPDM